MSIWNVLPQAFVNVIVVLNAQELCLHTPSSLSACPLLALIVLASVVIKLASSLVLEARTEVA